MNVGDILICPYCNAVMCVAIESIDYSGIITYKLAGKHNLIPKSSTNDSCRIIAGLLDSNLDELRNKFLAVKKTK